MKKARKVTETTGTSVEISSSKINVQAYLKLAPHHIIYQSFSSKCTTGSSSSLPYACNDITGNIVHFSFTLITSLSQLQPRIFRGILHAKSLASSTRMIF